MSDQHSPRPADDHEDLPHEGPIKTPKQLVWAVIASFVVPVLGIILLVNYVASGDKPAAGSDAFTEEAIARRLQPVGTIEIREAGDMTALKSGIEVYKAQCAVCHDAGVAGAPKLGDRTAWAERLRTGYEALLTSALKGKGAMAAQGGGAFSDLEIGRAVVHMANESGGNFEEPKAPEATAASAPPPAAAPAPAAAAAPAAPTPAPAPAAPAAVAQAAPAAAAAAAASSGAEVGRKLYAQACQVCHVAGVAGAPRLGDKAAWAPRLAQGVDGLTATVIKGKGAMPPRGGAGNASDADLRAAVEYMVDSVK